MNRKFFSIVMIAALALVAVGCSDDDDKAESSSANDKLKAFYAALLTPGTEQSPQWEFSDYFQYEMSMSIQVQLGDTLAHYMSSEDRMCATVGGEMRAASSPETNGTVVYIPLVIAGGSDDEYVTLQYYCSRLKRIYTLPNWALFNPAAAPTGTDGIYRPKFIGSMEHGDD